MSRGHVTVNQRGATVTGVAKPLLGALFAPVWGVVICEALVKTGVVICEAKPLNAVTGVCMYTTTLLFFPAALPRVPLGPYVCSVLFIVACRRLGMLGLTKKKTMKLLGCCLIRILRKWAFSFLMMSSFKDLRAVPRVEPTGFLAV